MPMSLIGVVGIVALLVIVGLAAVTRYKVAKPNEAFIITGRRGAKDSELSGQRVVIAAGTWLIPFVQKLSIMDLSSRRIPIKVTEATAANGIMLNVTGIAQLKVGGNKDAVRAAAQRFGADQDAIAEFAVDNLSATLRGIVGTLTVEEIIKDRTAFGNRVSEATEAILTNQGLAVDSFQVLEVADTSGNYLKNLGRPEIARVEQLAAISEADARRVTEEKRLQTEEAVMNAEREVALRRAAIKSETDRAQADADAAGPIAQAAREQEIIAAQEKVAIRQAELTDRELDTKVRKPADASRYAAEQQALGAKATALAEAEAAAERERLTGVAERDRRSAIADAVKAEGEAQAEATKAVGLAEAAAIAARAEAMNALDAAGTRQLIIEKLPEVARELAAPISNVKDLTILSTDGASALPKAVANNGEQMFSVIKSMTGLDVKQLLSGLVSPEDTSSASSSVTMPASSNGSGSGE